ncbi:DUF4089 domain-containing protein [Microcoleus sp. FACHB-1515]|uniref:DUF4089 domain-containing protein n=2 Tax=Cyanophyceae TaxID=3028117 RepID=UPI001685E1AC|nr:DUF4089 domain-containing protein [Microcoleus sp. FACHB-1515]MBD2089657.1 DUF4089 domain-containing protein [Microcoleus sp. FACHB-1515]
MPEPNQLDVTAFVEQQAIALDLPIADYQAGVTANFERIRSIAQAFLEFPLPTDLVAAPRFEP